MNENERYRLVHEIYGESNLENVKWHNPKIEDFKEALHEYEKGYMYFIQSFLESEKNDLWDDLQRLKMQEGIYGDKICKERID